MFKLNKYKSGKGGPKFDFLFSDFQAIKVPKGWDKLFVSLVSVETGKTSVKTGKSSVRNGICRWTETLQESVSIAQDKGDTKELEGCLCRIVIAMGSSRSGVLGEVTINLADYASSKASVPLSLLLKKCNYGTSLQFKIQCLTPKANDRDSQNKYTVMHVENGNDDIENRSDASEGSFSRSMASMSGNHLGSTSTAGLSREPSLSASDSRQSFDSIEASPGHDVLSPQSNLFGASKQNPVESQNNVPSHGIHATDDRSNHSRVVQSFSPYALNQEEQNSSAFVSSPHSNTGSSKDLLEAAEGTIEELRAEARMWERNAKKLTHDMEALREEMSERARSQETLSMELSASQKECSNLKQEIEQLKILLEESENRDEAATNLRLQSKDIDDVQKEMEEELKFQKESNADLTEQLQKTQESNVELLSILQELEAIVETQKSEIENLSSQKLRLQESENQNLPENIEVLSDSSMSDSKFMDPTQYPDEPFPEGVQNLKLQLQQLQETQEELESSIRELEKSLEEKDDEIEREQDLRVKALLESESKWRLELDAKEEEIMNMEAKLSKFLNGQENKRLVVESGDKTDLDQEIDVFKNHIKSLEDQMADTCDKNHKLQEKIEVLEREKSSLSFSLEELKEEIALLTSSVDSHVSENKALERLSSELGKGKEDLEQQLSDLEKENMQLSERLSAMEAQLRHLTDEKEACLLDLRLSETQSMKLRDEIGRLEIEVHTHKVEGRLKVQDMQNRWLEAQEECENLKKVNPKLQSTAENLIEECTALQKLNGEMKRQNMVLSKQCALVESQLRDTQEKYTKCSEKIKALEEEFLRIADEVSMKEKSLNSELESLIIEDREHREKVMQENVLLNELCKLKVAEVENLQKELVHLIDQISVAPDDQGTSIKEAILEVSNLRAEKAKLEVSLQEVTDKFALSQNKLSSLEAETEAKVQQLIGELTALRKSQEVLSSNHENLKVSLESFQSSEEKNKIVINELEISLKALKCERLQLAEEISSLKEQLQRANLYQVEVLDLKILLSDAKFECEKVKSSFELLRGDHEELKAEKESLVQKISTMQKSLLELEDCQRSKIALEEKVLRLEGDLVTKEALCAQDAELKIELSNIKRTNGELHRKIKYLEQDLEGYLKKVQVQEKLQPEGEAMLDQMSSADPDGSTRNEKHFLAMRGVQNTDYLSRIQHLQTELTEAMEANDMYKAQAQLRRFMSEEQCYSDNLKTSGNDNVLGAESQGSNVSLLEIELKDLRERYFQMSLRYAEVEAQREELVLKLKSTNNRKGWFF